MQQSLSRRSFLAGAAATALAAGSVTLFGCGQQDNQQNSTSADNTSSDASSTTAEKKTIVVGSKQFTEEFILAELYSLALEDNGFTVNRLFQMSTDTLVPAMEKGEVDMYPEYIGTCLTDILGQELETDKDKVYEIDQRLLMERYGIKYLDLTNVQDKLCMVMLTDKANQMGISNLSELQQQAGSLVLGSIGNFSEREDDLLRMNKFYGEYKFKDVIEIDYTLAYSLLDDGTIDTTCANTTDAALSDSKYKVLDENITIWPPQFVGPMVRNAVLEQYPEIEEILNKVSAKLDTETMVALNSRVDLDGEEYEDVAKDFYEKNCK